MAEWFVQQPDVDLGPLRPAELLQLVRNGIVEPQTKVRKDDSAWFDASQVGGLFEAARRPTIEHYCPRCSTRVTAPPCTCPKCDIILEKTRKRIIEHSVGQKSSDNPTASNGPAESAKRWLQRKIKRDEP